jgi:hypothetical protein
MISYVPCKLVFCRDHTLGEVHKQADDQYTLAKHFTSLRYVRSCCPFGDTGWGEKYTVTTTRALLLCLLTEEELILSRGGAGRRSDTRCSTSKRKFVLEEYDQGKALSKALNIEQVCPGLSCIESLHRLS